MTPTQYYFPYFFHVDHFNEELKPFGLTSSRSFNAKTEMPENLLINNLSSGNSQFAIPFGATIMVEHNNLFYWKTDYDVIEITQVRLDSKEVTNRIDLKINISQLPVGKSKIETSLDFKNFVTFLRKSDLKYEQEYYDQFVIVLINDKEINIIPFDWFNKTGGDYGYVWPATARLDNSRNKVYGQGMRMSDFKVNLDEAGL